MAIRPIRCILMGPTPRPKLRVSIRIPAGRISKSIPELLVNACMTRFFCFFFLEYVILLRLMDMHGREILIVTTRIVASIAFIKFNIGRIDQSSTSGNGGGVKLRIFGFEI